MVYLNYRVGTTALRRYFDNVHPNLPSDLSSPTNKSILSNLYKPPGGQREILYQEQWDILYPPSGSHVVSSADLDVTLMVCILRNIPPQVSPPTKGFDVLPHSTDVTPGAHIARIKYYKNFLVSHSKDGKLADVDFNTIWTDLEMAIHGLGNQQDVTDAADAKSKVLDYKTIKELMMIEKRLIDHTIILAEHTTRIAQLETEKATKKGIACRSSKGGFNEFKDELIRSTILDEEVLDILISKCVLILDDKDEIDSFSDQSSRNNKLLEILMYRPYHTFNIFVEALKESDQKCHTALLANMEAKITDKSLTLQQPIQYKEDIADIEKQTVKLIKWFKTLVHEIDVDKTGILDKLSAKGIIRIEDKAELRSAALTPREKSRGLLENIIRKNNLSANTTFLDVLREDSCYQEYAAK
ncbi:unnamed protein product [Mytilus edulis]|uniref:CARD domain-containing protein n=1 Tax=Mytilus edulis TaxID=6550 RepID=A0A8S3SRU5_MYTED|nr:unnamed protein product [Mytilus edulis]